MTRRAESPPQNRNRTRSILRRLPPHGWAGIVLISVFWPLNWLLPGLRTHLLFFPLWLGYILSVDAVVVLRAGRSILTSTPRKFAGLFAVSIPLWWVFEFINERTENWHYVGAEAFGDLTYAILATIAFSTVVPAVIESAELISTCSCIDRFQRGWRLPHRDRFGKLLFATGWIMLALIYAWPEVFYPFVWGALYAIVDPVNQRLGRFSLLARLHEGDWRPLLALSAGALLCGFFWEMWNYHAFPKWTYRTPGVDFLYVFEMPLLGYVGYLPFAWEVYAFLHLVMPDPPRLRLTPTDWDSV